MEAVDVAQAERMAEVDGEKTVVAKEGTARKMFAYSGFLDVGEGAEECEHKRGGCQDTEHFHAWCRLPNPYQHEDIRAKGLAARARRIRTLADPESDASVVLDQTLAAISDPIFVDSTIDELLGHDWAENYLDAQRDVGEREEFEHIVQDQEEYVRLQAAEEELSEEEQSADYKQLRTHVAAYMEAVRVRLEEIRKPNRDDLASRPIEAIVKLVRAKRVEDLGDRAFLDTYNAWTWYVGTFRVDLHPTLKRPHIPMWDDIGRRDKAAAGTMFGESPEVIDALKVKFNALQLALQRGSAGN